jgi:alkanesulfonate monooxygenase SsuD/methylene tetrahydromethanopterin reductase-like flavin-dependent oxidoreductase (luciferase family)
MLRDQHCNVEELRDLSYRLEDAGYESVLLTFHSSQADYFIKSAAAIVPGHKLKYMIALRPYHVSPQYCSMMTMAYNEIDQGRLVFNWVAGDFHNRSDEPDIEFDIFGKSDLTDTIKKRTTFLRDFVKMYKMYCPISVMPPMVFSGFSDYTLDTAKMFSGTSLCMIDTYRENLNKFDGIKNRMVSAFVTIIESEKEIEEFKKITIPLNPRHMNFSIIGNYETVKEQILNLKDEKITDLLVVTEVTHMDESWNKENDVIVNKLIKEINSEIKQHVS